MDSGGKMDRGKQANGSTDRHDGGSACRDIQQVVLTQPTERANHSIPATAFPRFSKLPWELRRTIWEFALPRSVFMSTILGPTDCVPYPPVGLACREAHLVAAEFGSMVTAWKKSQVNRCWEISWRPENQDITWPEDVPKEADMSVRTWFSPKLDTLVFDAGDDEIPYWRDDHTPCDFIDFDYLSQSLTTRLVVQGGLSVCTSEDLEDLYQTHLRDRGEILLCVGSFSLTFTDQAWDISEGLNISQRPGNRTQIIYLDDPVALAECLKLWEECHDIETRERWGDHDFGKWLDTTVNGEKGAGTDFWARTYNAWVAESQEFEERLVSPEAYFLLQIVDVILHSHGSIRNTGRGSWSRGHEVLDDTGRLKENHPLVQELDIKLPKIIPVFTVSIAR